MGRRGRDAALFFLRFLVFPLVIYGTGDHGISSLIANPLSAQARTRALIYKTLGKPSSGSSLTFLHAAGTQLKNRIGPRSLPGPQPSILTPSIVTSPGADFVKGLSPVIWPLQPEPNHKHGSSTLYSHSPEESARTYPAVAPATPVLVHKEGQRGNLAPTPFSLFTLSAPSALHRHVPFPKVKRSYALPPALSPTPLYSFKAPKKKIWHFALPPRGAEVNLAPPPKLTTKKSSNDPSPRAEGPRAKIAHSHPCVDIHKKPFFPPVQVPFTSSNVEESMTPASTPTCQKHNKWLTNYPSPSPSYFRRKSESPLPQPTPALPPPPPNLNCGSITCQEPLANPVLGPPCACVLPIKVGLNLGVALYKFFPLVSEFAQEIASAVFVKQNQVRIIGANATFEDPERTVVLIDLVPIGKYFDSAIAFLTYEKFWHKKVAIQVSYFGDYDVLYVLYPGLPPAPPATPANINVEGGAYGNGNNGRAIQPLGVDVRKKKSKMKPNGSLIAIIVLSSVISIVVILGVAWFLLLVHREHSDLPSANSQSILPFTKLSAAHAVLTTAGSRPSSASLSSSNIPAYNGSAKKFSLYEIERITSKFDESRVIGEGGFGRVYQGTVEDGTRVAVKVLKRDDQQGEREFFAEVEMLSRLHHRNLVKLIGICSEENMRCLIYELVPNGSVDSHLHGVDKKITPLDWQARMKIALGTARALAYLHEDSSPRVIHRDFKSSNILLEHDFTPKVSDFGLARTARDEGNEHISTRVMGTFGYVAPEYAMTGHLLVKSDVYSYGVVLLELLTGRKPIDMSQPPGQENLVSWARPLLSKAERIVDPSLGNCYPHDSIAKVMAIASMCVEPEVSHRPFMGEVVQALKLVCNKGEGCSHSEIWDNDGSPSVKEAAIARVGTPQSGMLYASERNVGNEDALGLFRTHSSSNPLGTGRSRHFWQS